MRLLLLAGVAAALLAAAVVVVGVAAGAVAGNPCDDGTGKLVKNCKVTLGPWVVVPASGETDFLLECPKRQGYINGVSVAASSPDVRVGWEATPGAPVRPGTSTGFSAFFSAASAHGQPGLFQPSIGCLPQVKTKPRSILSARITLPGAPLDRRQTLFTLKSGASQSASESCGKGERLLSGWYAVVFGAAKPPDPALGSKVQVTLAVESGKVVATTQTDSGVPAAAQIELQVGAVCAK